MRLLALLLPVAASLPVGAAQPTVGFLACGNGPEALAAGETARRARSAFRHAYHPWQPVYDVGFRVVCEDRPRQARR